MVDRDVLAARLLYLNDTLRRIEDRFPGGAAGLAADPVLRAAIERWLQTAIEACLDIAYHLVADRGWRPPDSAREVFGVLADHGALDAQLASRLARAVSLRNILVHVYVAVDLERLSGVIRNDLGDLRAFAAAAARWLEESP